MTQWLRCLAPKHEFAGSNLHWILKQVSPDRYIDVWRCGGPAYDGPATERPYLH